MVATTRWSGPLEANIDEDDEAATLLVGIATTLLQLGSDRTGVEGLANIHLICVGVG